MSCRQPPPMSDNRLRTLSELAKCGERGTCHVPGVMHGGTLAALVQLGLAERIPEDSLGGQRYRISQAGLEALR